MNYYEGNKNTMGKIGKINRFTKSYVGNAVPKELVLRLVVT